MVVREAGHDVRADAGVRERPGDGRGQPDGLERRVDLQRDPGRHVRVREAQRVGRLLRHDHGHALVLPHDDHRRDSAGTASTWAYT